ncbi:MAG: hypothetical protein LUQ22_05135, partial [Methanotrichaceae archaeon]|nr:hypothetical protein [Methanotrichaceae archaeon]
MIWSKKCLVGPRMAPDVVNPRMLELEVTKEMLNELFDLRTHEDQAEDGREDAFAVESFSFAVPGICIYVYQ